MQREYGMQVGSVYGQTHHSVCQTEAGKQSLNHIRSWQSTEQKIDFQALMLYAKEARQQQFRQLQPTKHQRAKKLE